MSCFPIGEASAGSCTPPEGGWWPPAPDVVVLAPGGTQPNRVLPRGTGVTGYNDLAVTPEGGLLVGALRYRPFAGEQAIPGDLVLLREGLPAPGTGAP